MVIILVGSCCRPNFGIADKCPLAENTFRDHSKSSEVTRFESIIDP